MKIYAIVPAAGNGARMGLNKNKLFAYIDGKPVLQKTLEALWASGCFDRIIIPCKQEEIGQIRRIAESAHIVCELVSGGQTRQQSVYNALKRAQDADIIAVHDGARCNVSTELIEKCVMSAIRRGSGVAGRVATDTVKVVKDGVIQKTLNRDEIVLIETPQVFEAGLLINAYENAYKNGISATDDCSLVEQLGERPYLVVSQTPNVKITVPADISNTRIGHGMDVHAFCDDRDLILGGVKIDYKYGLKGHSDADVLVHAVMDALLGAAGLPDIGNIFPDTDDRYKDISSLKLLEQVGQMLRQRNFSVLNIDCTLVLQEPKVAPYKNDMVQNIADVLGIQPSKICVKATTTERLGYLGRGEGVSAYAVCIIS